MIEEFDVKINSADSKLNDLYSFAAFIQGFIVLKEGSMEAYKNFIDALYWGLGSEQKYAIKPSLNYMDNIVEELRQMSMEGSVIHDWNIQINQIPISLNLLKKHSKYKEISKSVELIEKQRIEIVNKIYNDNFSNKG